MSDPTVCVVNGVICVGGVGLDLDAAEKLARQILEAVEEQRAENRQREDMRLAELAGGNARTHDWETPANGGQARCRRCNIRASEPCIQYGQVPSGCPPEVRCPLGWHAITPQVHGDPTAAGDCYHCLAVFPSTAGAQ